jgi:tRNA nucleotidyltransferase (CCA-adding enzyme)
MIKAYLVGGYVRDQLLGVQSKDLDYTVVAPSYSAMVEWIKEQRGKIFIENPEYLTVRAHLQGKKAADFVLARRDGTYTDGRRPDLVEPGTLYDDLARRDFTMNAMAYDEETGEYIDPHKGKEDLAKGIIRCVGDTKQRFSEDALRMLRALRFSVTKNMLMSGEILESFFDEELIEKLRNNVSMERKREELMKAFSHNTIITMKHLIHFHKLGEACLGTDLEPKMWLLPTTKTP